MAKDNDKKSINHFAIGALLGMAAGAVAGLLFAPKSGKETRADLKDGIDDAKDLIGDKGADVAEFAKDTTAEAKSQFAKAAKTTKQQADAAVKVAQKRLDEAKQLAKRVKKGEIDPKSQTGDLDDDEE
ncbi:MAG: YtxH domain-containing protein [Candidatus Nanoperiomorbaceae bacterium]